MSAAWIEEEPGLREALAELGRLFSRALRRWGWTLLVLSLVLAAVVVRRVRKKPFYPARVVLRIAEGDGDVAVIPRTSTKLQEYVASAVFTDGKLTDIMKRHDIEASLFAKNPRMALSKFRDEIDVVSFRNHFVEQRAPGDPPRSARVSIRYRDVDPERAVAVVHELAGILRDHETKRRIEDAREAKELAQRAVDRAASDLDAANRRMAILTLLSRSPDLPTAAQAYTELDSLQRALPNELLKLDEAEAFQKQVDLRVGLEERALGLRFEIADATPPLERRVLWVDVLLNVLGTLAFGTPFLMLLVGAFDRRVHDAGDVRRLGLRCLGVVSAWPPDHLDPRSREGRAGRTGRSSAGPRAASPPRELPA